MELKENRCKRVNLIHMSINIEKSNWRRRKCWELQVILIWIVCYTRLYHLREIFETMDRAECVCQRKNNELLKYKLYIYILMSTQRCSFCYWLFTMNSSTYRVALHQQCNGVSQNDSDGDIQSITSKMWTLLLDCSENVFEINRCFSSESV